ncbi:CE1759 family FMN reductase, partial [Corynebacterium sp.]|uniref:CE1759 family FMN reductase n=1 Tax=Corynebacterium sp. TaxID=1720 RepID=UPI002A90FAC4
MPTLFVISAGVSTPSTTRQVADALAEAVANAAGSNPLDITTVELREYASDLAHAVSTGISTKRLDELKRSLSAADGLIAATPVFAASYSGLFKMFFDILDTDALNGMPTILAATAGTPRHSLVTEHAMRPLLTYLRAVIVPTSVFAATEDFGGVGGKALNQRIERAAQELAGLMFSTPNTRFSGPENADYSTRPRKSGLDLDD